MHSFINHNLAVPLDEFPNLVHPNSEPSVASGSPCDPTQSLPVVQPIRQSFSVRKPPSYLQNYHCNLAAAHVSALVSLSQSDDSTTSSDSGILYPLVSTLSYAKLSSSYNLCSCLNHW